jgi:hypothetical protein
MRRYGRTGSKASVAVDWNSGTPIDFVASVVDATRFPSVCGVANPPFMNGDFFDLDIAGGATTGGRDNPLTLTFTSPGPPLGTPVALPVFPFTVQGSGVDGRQLDQTFSSPVTTEAGGCPVAG